MADEWQIQRVRNVAHQFSRLAPFVSPISVSEASGHPDNLSLPAESPLLDRARKRVKPRLLTKPPQMLASLSESRLVLLFAVRKFVHTFSKVSVLSVRPSHPLLPYLIVTKVTFRGYKWADVLDTSLHLMPRFQVTSAIRGTTELGRWGLCAHGTCCSTDVQVIGLHCSLLVKLICVALCRDSGCTCQRQVYATASVQKRSKI